MMLTFLFELVILSNRPYFLDFIRSAYEYKQIKRSVCYQYLAALTKRITTYNPFIVW